MSNVDLIGFTRIFDILLYQKQKYPQNAALNIFVNNSWRGLSIDEILKKILMKMKIGLKHPANAIGLDFIV